MAGHGRRCGYRHILDAFWDEAKLVGVPLPTEQPVSAPAFCQARAKLSPEFLRSLLHEVGARFDGTFEQDARWNGRRVLATDCTGLNLQRSEELVREFGKADSAYCPQAQISTLFNVKSRVPIDVVIARYKASERKSLLEDHLPLVARGDILVLDRGYPGFAVFEKLIEARADFVVRVPTRSGFIGSRTLSRHWRTGSHHRAGAHPAFQFHLDETATTQGDPIEATRWRGCRVRHDAQEV